MKERRSDHSSSESDNRGPADLPALISAIRSESCWYYIKKISADALIGDIFLTHTTNGQKRDVIRIEKCKTLYRVMIVYRELLVFNHC